MLIHTAADVTKPLLTLPTGIATGTTTATLTVNTNEDNGPVFVAVTTSATPPLDTAIITGTGFTYASNQTVSSVGTKTFLASGLPSATTLWAHYVHRDAAGNISLVATTPASFTTATVVSGGTYEPGWNAALDEGTAGDFFVDSSRPDDTGAGTSLATAKKTITAALALAVAGKTVKIKDNGVPYRESVSLSGKGGSSSSVRTRLIGYGTGKPTISAADVLTGFVPCVIGDAPVVGPNWASVYKKTGIAKSIFVDSLPTTMNLYENGVALNEAISRADNSNPFFTTDPYTYWTADVVYTTGDVPATASTHPITGIKDVSVTDLYTAAQILRANMMFVFGANHIQRSAIASFDPADDIVRPTMNTLVYVTTNPPGKNWALINLLPAIAQGGYGYTDTPGDATKVDLYVWPRVPANINTGIEYSARSTCIDSVNASFIEIASIRTVQATSLLTGGPTGNGFRTGSSSSGKKTFITIRNCYTAEHFSIDGAGYGSMYFGNTDDCKIINCTIAKCRGMLGPFFQGDLNSPISTTDFSTRNEMRYCEIVDVENSPFHCYTVREHILAYCRSVRSGFETHANKLNFYEQSHDVLVWGVDWQGTEKYVTWQECDNIFIAFCKIPAGTTTARALDDQNSVTATPGTYLGDLTDSLLFNLTVPPHPVDLSSTAMSFAVGAVDHPLVTFKHYNNILHGDNSKSSQITDRDYTVDTTGAVFGDHSVASSLGAVYVDASVADYTLKPTGPVPTTKGKNMQSLITNVLIPRFGARFTDWNKDMLGQTIDWTDAPIGHVRIRAVAADTTAPTLLRSVPADNATGVNINADIELRFSEDVVAGTGNFYVYKTAGDVLVQTVAVGSATFANHVVTVPISTMLGSTAYYVKADAGCVKDLSNNPWAGITTTTALNFTTVSGTDINFVGGAYTATAPAINSLPVNIGSAGLRTIIVAVGYEGGQELTGVIVDPLGENVTLAQVCEIGPTGVTCGVAIYKGTVTGGGTKTVKVTSGLANTNMGVAVFEVSGTLSSEVVFAGSIAATTITGSNTVPANGVMIGVFSNRTAAVTNTYTRSDLGAVTLAYSSTANGATGAEFSAVISKAVTGVSTTLTVNNTTGSKALIAAAWSVT